MSRPKSLGFDGASVKAADGTRFLSNVYVQAALIAIVLTSLSFGVGIGFGWITTINWLEVFAVLTSYACTYLCVKERRWNYPIGAVSTASLAILYFQSNLIASAFLNLWLVFQLLYGWFRWRADAITRPVTRVQAKWIPVYILASLAFFGVAYLIVTALGGAMAPLDVGILLLTILAQFLLDNKKIETWFVWGGVNILAIYVYFSAGLFLVGFQYIFFLANTIYGAYCWKKSMNGVSDTVLPTVPVVQNA